MHKCTENQTFYSKIIDEAKKSSGSAEKNRVGRVSGNKQLFLRLMSEIIKAELNLNKVDLDLYTRVYTDFY